MIHGCIGNDLTSEQKMDSADEACVCECGGMADVT